MFLKIITNDGSISFGDNGYGELAIMIKGPRDGERGYDLISKADAEKLAYEILKWVRPYCNG